MTPSIWTQETPADLHAWLGGLWSGPQNKSNFASPFTVAWLDESSHHRLQRLLEGLLSELRYQTCELFLAEPNDRLSVVSTPPIIVAAAYKKARGSCVYDLSTKQLARLRSALTVGEPIEAMVHRISQYANGVSDEEIEYIRYSLFGTLISTLAATLPPGYEDMGASLLNHIKTHARDVLPSETTSYKGFPSPSIRLALRSILRIIRPALFFEAPPTQCEQAEIIRLATELEKKTNDAHLRQALDLMIKLSRYHDDLLDALRPSVAQIPAELAMRMFSAALRSYPTWLHSATLEADKSRTAVVAGDLTKAIRASVRSKHKHVNALSLRSYERAARWILSYNRSVLPLRSMFVIPFRHRKGALEYVGLLRFMNRYTEDHGSDPLFQYTCDESGFSSPTSEEDVLAPVLLEFFASILEEEIKPSQHGHTIRSEQWQEQHGPTIITSGSPNSDPFNKLVGSSEAWRSCIATARCVATRDDPVLLIGEDGTGKDRLAMAIHEASSRKGQFIPVIVANLSGQNLTAEVFGLGPGFIGLPKGNPGAAEMADGGTLFLNEIGELPIIAQAMLNDFVQDGRIRRGGEGVRSSKSTARVVAATNAKLSELIRQGKFRRDLFMRFFSGLIRVPPLRDRYGDVDLLFRHFQATYLPTTVIEEDAMQLLREFHWPGNVRALQGMIMRLRDTTDANGVISRRTIRPLLEELAMLEV